MSRTRSVGIELYRYRIGIRLGLINRRNLFKPRFRIRLLKGEIILFAIIPQSRKPRSSFLIKSYP